MSCSPCSTEDTIAEHVGGYSVLHAHQISVYFRLIWGARPNMPTALLTVCRLGKEEQRVCGRCLELLAESTQLATVITVNASSSPFNQMNLTISPESVDTAQ